MKKIFASMLLPLLFAGCVELDYFRSDTMTSAQLAADPSAASYITDGVYAMMKDRLGYPDKNHKDGNNTFIRQYFQLGEFRGDNICLSGSTTDPLFNAATLSDDQDSANSGYYWFASYKMLYAVNANLNGLKEGVSPEGDWLMGENYFLRAFLHFGLCNLFAKPYSAGEDNPGIVLRTSLDMSNTTRATVGACYKSIVDDLKEAWRLMGKNGVQKRGSDNGYATKQAAQALLSRVYLYMGENAKCKEVCDSLIGTTPEAYLETDLNKLYGDPRKSKEVIWCIDMVNAEDDWNKEPRSTVGSMYYSNDGLGNLGWAEIYVSDPLLDLMLRFPNDKRYNQMVELYYANPGLMVTWGHDGGDPNRKNRGVYTGVTGPAADGSYSFTHSGRAMRAVKNTANPVCADFPGYVLENPQGVTDTVCYVRPFSPDMAIDDNPESPTYGTLVYPGVRYTYPAWMCKKFSYQDGAAGVTSPIMLRYGEVVINRAEAEAKLGLNAAALDDVNVLRTRAGLTGDELMSDANMAGRGYANYLDMVLDERRLELYYESQRAFDLIRNGKNIDRRYPGMQDWEVVPFGDLRLQYQIPYDEYSISGITPNER